MCLFHVPVNSYGFIFCALIALMAIPQCKAKYSFTTCDARLILYVFTCVNHILCICIVLGFISIMSKGVMHACFIFHNNFSYTYLQ